MTILNYLKGLLLALISSTVGPMFIGKKSQCVYILLTQQILLNMPLCAMQIIGMGDKKVSKNNVVPPFTKCLMVVITSKAPWKEKRFCSLFL